MGKNYEVSVVVCMYDPDLNKALQTVRSVTAQKDVTVELIISDDGSKNNYFEEIENYLRSVSFDDYKMVACETNQGTVRNILRGVNAASGEYIKSISPGDFLNGDHILREWLEHLKSEGAKWSFSYVKNYTSDAKAKNKRAVIYPRDSGVYFNGSEYDKRRSYCVLCNVSVGAAMISERQIMLDYLEFISDKIKYTEDIIWRLMMFKGEVGCFYPFETTCYEVGTGISTSGSKKWRRIISDELGLVSGLMKSLLDPDDGVQRKLLKEAETTYCGGFFSHLFLPGKIKLLVRTVLFKRKKLEYIRYDNIGG